jgi:hypothetical protein
VPFSQIDDILVFNNDERVVRASGPLWRPQDPPLKVPQNLKIPKEDFKTFTIRVCQTDHQTGSSEQNLAEGTAVGDDPGAFKGDGTWTLALPYIRDQTRFMHHMDGTATAVLVFESGGDLFSLTWAECVLLWDESEGPPPEII